MSAPARLALFTAALALIFAASALAGSAVGPEPKTDPEPTHAGDAPHDAPTHDVRGLATTADGLRLLIETPELRRGRTEKLAFRIVDEHDKTASGFDVEHTKRMHLIVARRDLTGFQHLHPVQRSDGVWETPIRIRDAGSYRVFADFARDGEPLTLAGDLRVDGAADLRALPAPAATAASDGGYDVELRSAGARPGEEADLRFTITKQGKQVATEPYLGAGGHLVALREGDLAFLHVHPTNEAGSSEVGFGATFPTAGRYRLFLQFQMSDPPTPVQTAAFTQEVR